MNTPHPGEGPAGGQISFSLTLIPVDADRYVILCGRGAHTAGVWVTGCHFFLTP